MAFMPSLNGVAVLGEATPAASKGSDDPSPSDVIWLTHSKDTVKMISFVLATSSQLGYTYSFKMFPSLVHESE